MMPNMQSSSCSSSPSNFPSYQSEDSLTSLIGAAMASSSQDSAPPQRVVLPTFGTRSNQDLAHILGQVLEIMEHDSPVAMDDGFEDIFGLRVSSSPHRGAKQ